MLKLISFDLDDSLWPCMPTIERAENLIYHWLQLNFPVITEHYSLHELTQKRRLLIQHSADFNHDLSAARMAHFRQLGDEFLIGRDWIDDAFKVYFNARQQVTLFDDVRPVLEKLKKTYILIALTNGNADIQMTGVAEYFQFQLSAADVKAAKPAPEMFLEMMRRTGVSAADCMHVGDHAEHDIKGAANAGIKSVWLNRQQQSWTENDFVADYEIHNLHQLISLIETFI